MPANKGEEVELFVRERVRGDDRHKKHHNKPVVLMVQGAATPVVATFDLRFENYSWMAFLAEAGFDVFAMDLTGYGLSPRPMMDNPCNTSPSDQRSFLIPNPLAQPCSPTYPFTLTNMQSDWDEIDTVVDYVRDLRGVDKVNLLGWSRAGVRIGGYTVRHPEKVEKLFLFAPTYNRLAPSDPPRVLPQPGVPMTVLGSAAFFNNPLASWDQQVKCPNQFTPPIRDAIRSTLLDFDELGAEWGAAGVQRSPLQGTLWGWNPTFARLIEAPTLIIAGDVDTTTGVTHGRNLYDDLLIDSKVFVHVACASHFLAWENQHMILLRASEEWLRHGTFAGHDSGSFSVATDGHVHEE